MKKINLASGQRPFDKPWLNLDIRDQGYKVDIIADMKKLDMLEDNSVDVLVAHHCLEHVDMSEVGPTSREWNRVLKPGGKLAVFVPNMRALVDRWTRGEIDDYIFNVNVFGAYQGHLTDLHRWSYTEKYLEEMMRGRDNEIPWAEVRSLTFNDCMNNMVYEGADLAFDWWVLAMEFTK